jgi:hypothetical protein
LLVSIGDSPAARVRKCRHVRLESSASGSRGLIDDVVGQRQLVEKCAQVVAPECVLVVA